MESTASGFAKLFDREILVHPRMTKVNAGRPAVAKRVVGIVVFTSLETEADTGWAYDKTTIK